MLVCDELHIVIFGLRESGGDLTVRSPVRLNRST